MFNLIRNSDGGTRLIDAETGKQFGEYFQALLRSIEWQAALIVYEKYRRKHELTHDDFLSLKDFATEFSNLRKANGKSINQDFLVQKCSDEIKRIIRERASSTDTEKEY